MSFGACRISIATLLLCLFPLNAANLMADHPAPVTKQSSAEFRAIVKKVLPAVVSITSKYVDERVRRFGIEEVPESVAFGSGAIIDKSGIILTNNHVVEDAKEVTIALHDGREFVATDIVRDPKTDVAIVRLKPEDVSGIELPTAELGDSDSAEIGDWVLAMGSPFGLSGSVTSGIISGKSRAPRELDIKYKDFIQTDAAINPGNSGGPLIDLDGRIIGINTAIRSNTGTFGGIGFAIPSNMARRVADQLIQHGRVRRSYLGVEMRPLSRDELVSQHIDSGIRIANLTNGETPARKAGLQTDDVILSFDGQTIDAAQKLQNLVSMTPAGETVTLQVLRGGEKIDVPVKLEEEPKGFGEFAAKIQQLGMVVVARNGKLLVIQVTSGSPADRAGIDAGDVIEKVGDDRKEVSSVQELEEILSAEEGDILVKIQKKDGTAKLVVLQQKE